MMEKSRKRLEEMSNEELWQLFPIILTEHRECWAVRYEEEREKLVRSLGFGAIARISHIGSTCVSGLPAKPTIDILIEIREGVDTANLVEMIRSLGYYYVSQPSNPPPHMMFMKGYTPEGFRGQAFHVHVRYAGDWDELYFRDYLQVHPDTARSYGELKWKLKECFEHDRDAYTQAKTDFIRGAVGLAREEFGSRYSSV